MTSRVILHGAQGSVCIELHEGSVLVTVKHQDQDFQIEAGAEKRDQLRELLRAESEVGVR